MAITINYCNFYVEVISCFIVQHVSTKFIDNITLKNANVYYFHTKQVGLTRPLEC